MMEDPRCEYGLRSGWAIVQGAVMSEGVVFRSPPFGDHLSLPESAEDLPVE